MQAPIGPATTAELVAAVTRAGALGTLAASWTPLDALRRAVADVRGQTSQPFCVNLVLAFEQRERLEAALELGVPVISFSWGVDPQLIELACVGSAFVLVQVGDPEGAVAAEAAGADAVVVQGLEAGGHVEAKRSLIEALVATRERVAVPLIAAGGIGDAHAARDALAAGADAVACGTAFLAAEEADVPAEYLDRLVRASAGDSVLTVAFDGGWPDAPHRVLRNSTLTEWEHAGRPRARRPGEDDVVAHRKGVPIRRYDDAQPTTSTTGGIEAMALYAGTSVDAVVRREPAAVIVDRICP